VKLSSSLSFTANSWIYNYIGGVKKKKTNKRNESPSWKREKLSVRLYYVYKDQKGVGKLDGMSIVMV